MKILQVTAIDFTLKKFLLPLVDQLSREGYTVHTTCNTSNISEDLRKEGYIIHNVPFSRDFNFFRHLQAGLSLYSLLRAEKYDIIHTHTPLASVIARIVARLARVNVIIYTAHGFYFHENMSRLAYNIVFYLEKILGKFFTDYILFQSKEDYELAVMHKFNKEAKLIHISNGVSAEFFNPDLYDRDLTRRELGLADGELAIIFVGRMVREKGVAELIEAFAGLIKADRSNLQLLLVGDAVAGDRDSFDVRQCIASHSSAVQEKIKLLGLRDDIPQLLLAADLFVLPSYREGLPRSIIEAMAMGRAVVATNIRGCREG